MEKFYFGIGRLKVLLLRVRITCRLAALHDLQQTHSVGIARTGFWQAPVAGIGGSAHGVDLSNGSRPAHPPQTTA